MFDESVLLACCAVQLSSRHSCLIWSTSPENAQHLLQLTTESFVDEVNTAFVSIHNILMIIVYRQLLMMRDNDKDYIHLCPAVGHNFSLANKSKDDVPQSISTSVCVCACVL